jgi:hypothetical protein
VFITLTFLSRKQHMITIRTTMTAPDTTPAVALLPQATLVTKWGRREISSSFGNAGILKMVFSNGTWKIDEVCVRMRLISILF